MTTTTTPEQDQALALLAAPRADTGPGLVLRPGGGEALHRAVSTQLGRLGRKDLLASPPMAALRHVKAGEAQCLSAEDAAALRAFAHAFPDSNTGMLLLGARLLADSVAKYRGRQATASS